MGHFPSLPSDVRERLAARGIDPEDSASAWLETILDGSFPIKADGTPRGPREAHRVAGGYRTPLVLPMALVPPDSAAL